jgi:hypothetical protein
MEPEGLPKEVNAERPSGKKQTFYCVKFFPTGDQCVTHHLFMARIADGRSSAWLIAKDISKLQKHEIEAFINEPHKKSGELMSGYRIALDPTKWEEELEARQAEVAEADANAEIDELEEEGDDNAKPEVGKTKKRKRDPEAKKAKKEKKEGSASATKKKPSAKTKTNGASESHKTVVESEDEADADEKEDAGPSKTEAAPPAKKAKRDKNVDDVDGV